jgi:hypothetical protein
VGAYFKKTNMNNSGYKITTDISMLEGPFSLEIAIKKGEKMMLCPQFKIPLRINAL